MQSSNFALQQDKEEALILLENSEQDNQEINDRLKTNQKYLEFIQQERNYLQAQLIEEVNKNNELEKEKKFRISRIRKKLEI